MLMDLREYYNPTIVNSIANVLLLFTGTDMVLVSDKL